MQVVRTLVGMALVTLLGCTNVANIQDGFRRADYRLPEGERSRIEMAAPVIVVGRVIAVNQVGGPRRSPGDSRVKTQLTRIRIDVEQAVKGNPGPSPTDFYYFTYALENVADLGVPKYVPEVGQRRIYFLKPWNNTYRSVGDVTNYTLRVPSGAHTTGFCRGKEPGCCIAEILLVPGPDLDAERFVSDLLKATYTAGEVCSPARARDLLKELTRNPDVRIANGAIDSMYMAEQRWPQLNSPPR